MELEQYIYDNFHQMPASMEQYIQFREKLADRMIAYKGHQMMMPNHIVGFTYSEQDSVETGDVYDIILADEEGDPMGIALVRSLSKGDYSDWFSGVLNTTLYIKPEKRGRGLAGLLLLKATEVVESRFPRVDDKPILFIESIIIPHEEAYEGLRAAMNKLLNEQGYKQMVDDPDFFIKFLW